MGEINRFVSIGDMKLEILHRDNYFKSKQTTKDNNNSVIIYLLHIQYN